MTSIKEIIMAFYKKKLKAPEKKPNALSSTSKRSQVEKPEKVKPTGPTCPRCNSTVVKQISAQREAAESREPTHRAVVGVKMISSIYACSCGKRFFVK